MNILFDTSFIIEIERQNKKAIELAKKLQLKGFQFLISSVTVSEVITGVYLTKDYEVAKERAITALNQFSWIELDGSIAFRTGEILAYLISNGQKIEYQDAVIAATAIESGSQYLVTQNKEHFTRIPSLKHMVFNIEEIDKKIL